MKLSRCLQYNEIDILPLTPSRIDRTQVQIDSLMLLKIKPYTYINASKNLKPTSAEKVSNWSSEQIYS